MSLYKSIELPVNTDNNFFLTKEVLAVIKKAERITFERSKYDHESEYCYHVKVRCTYSAKVEGEDEKIDVYTTFSINGYYFNPKEFSVSFTNAEMCFTELFKEGQELMLQLRRMPVYVNSEKHDEIVMDELTLIINRDKPTQKDILLRARAGSKYEYGLIGRKEDRITTEIEIIEPLQLTQ